MTTADTFLKTVTPKLDALRKRDATLYAELQATYRLTERPNLTYVDQAAPWGWFTAWGGLIVDDNGEDCTIRFRDGSQVYWDNWDRAWNSTP